MPKQRYEDDELIVKVTEGMPTTIGGFKAAVARLKPVDVLVCHALLERKRGRANPKKHRNEAQNKLLGAEMVMNQFPVPTVRLSWLNECN